MHKKIIFLIIVLLLSGCSVKNLKTINNIDLINEAITNEVSSYNVNGLGYRFYLPRGFSIIENKDYNQVLNSDGNKYYMYIDIVSYYNKSKINYDAISGTGSYEYLPIKYKDKEGYLKIVKNNDYFFIKMVYNYAIIEVQVKESKIKESIVSISNILASIKYNDIIIKNLIGESVLESIEAKYVMFGPENDIEKENFLEILEEYDKYEGSIDSLKDTDIIIEDSTQEEITE